MPLATYAELQDAIVDWYAGEDLQPVTADLIALAEDELNLRIRTRQRYAMQSLAFAAGDQSKTFEAAVRALLAVYINVSSVPPLEWRPPEAFWRQAAAFQSGTPETYTLMGNELWLAPATDAAITVRAPALVELPRLATAGTNWLLALSPRCYLYAALHQAALYVQDDQQAAKWRGFADQALAQLQADSAGIAPRSGRSQAA